MKFIDGDNNPMHDGYYANSRLGRIEDPSTMLCHVTIVYGDEVMAGAVDHNGNRYKLAMPQGLPDSERVPEGFLNTTHLFPVNSTEAISQLSHHQKTLQSKLDLFKI